MENSKWHIKYHKFNFSGKHLNGTSTYQPFKNYLGTNNSHFSFRVEPYIFQYGQIN